MRWRAVLIVLLSFAAAAGWWRAWQASGAKPDEFAERRLAFLATENARLTERLAKQQAEIDGTADDVQRAEIERTVANLRELPFTRPVKYKEIPRSELPVILQQKLFQQMPDREFADSAVALSALGLLPAGVDLKKTYLGLLGEQIGAFYDQHTREVFTFSGQPLSNAQNRVILAHELTHALEDQHFHLENLPLEAKGNDDRTLAASALVEGDATLVMNHYMLANLTGAVLKDSLASALTTDVRQLAAAPRFLRETLLFPYLKGQVFCEELYARQGWTALAAAFKQPPTCTAHILHPERFLAQPKWEPRAIELPTKTAAGRKPLVDNVVGEFGIQQLLKIWLGRDSTELAAGWCGDRYLVYGNAEANSYVWRSMWSSEADADRFAQAAAQGWEKRYGVRPSETNGQYTGTAGGRRFSLFRSGRSLALVEAQDQAWLAALTNLALEQVEE